MLLTPGQIKPKSFESRRNTFFLFLPGVDAPHVYVRAWALGCFYSHISTRTFRRALTASVDSCAEIKSAPTDSGVTRSGRVWRKVPESGVRSVRRAISTYLRSWVDLKRLPLLLGVAGVSHYLDFQGAFQAQGVMADFLDVCRLPHHLGVKRHHATYVYVGTGVLKVRYGDAKFGSIKNKK